MFKYINILFFFSVVRLTLQLAFDDYHLNIITEKLPKIEFGSKYLYSRNTIKNRMNKNPKENKAIWVQYKLRYYWMFLIDGESLLHKSNHNFYYGYKTSLWARMDTDRVNWVED